jgi:hypothetical protein
MGDAHDYIVPGGNRAAFPSTLAYAHQIRTRCTRYAFPQLQDVQLRPGDWYIKITKPYIHHSGVLIRRAAPSTGTAWAHFMQLQSLSSDCRVTLRFPFSASFFGQWRYMCDNVIHVTLQVTDIGMEMKKFALELR